MIDSRNYFAPPLRRFHEIRRARPEMSLLEEELLMATLLGNFVERHARLSLKECRRTENPFVSRYRWRRNGESLYVWLRRDLAGGDRAAWLEENIEDLDPTRPGEKQRVQNEVNRLLGQSRFVGLDEYKDTGIADRTSHPSSSWVVQYGISCEGLAGFVAMEKVQSIHRQRRAIRNLGPLRLKELVLEIFDRLDSSDYSAAEIARRYGLSSASLSRFAGVRWRKYESGDHRNGIPDLWVNLAHCLANHGPFIEAAKAAGVWPRVESIIRVHPQRT